MLILHFSKRDLDMCSMYSNAYFKIRPVHSCTRLLLPRDTEGLTTASCKYIVALCAQCKGKRTMLGTWLCPVNRNARNRQI